MDVKKKILSRFISDFKSESDIKVNEYHSSDLDWEDWFSILTSTSKYTLNLLNKEKEVLIQKFYIVNKNGNIKEIPCNRVDVNNEGSKYSVDCGMIVGKYIDDPDKVKAIVRCRKEIVNDKIEYEGIDIYYIDYLSVFYDLIAFGKSLS